MNVPVQPSPCGCACRREVRGVGSRWTARDWLGALRVRLGLGRSSYRVAPGLYTVGVGGAADPVFVTGNYKLSFDHLRRALSGTAAWILVLDTRGVNVWCAAAKGTFSASEIERRIATTQLADRVSHRQLVLPQLAGPGVAAHELRRTTGFTVVYGPIRASDLPGWLAAGRRKGAGMRRVSFRLPDRLTLVPVEITNALRSGLGAVAIIGALAAVRGRDEGALAFFGAYTIEWLGTLFVAALLVPVLLPWLPSRAFSVKGAVVGLVWSGGMLAAVHSPAPAWLTAAFHGPYSAGGAMLLATAYAAYLALNFTGATVFTSQSGTLFETRRALPAIAVTGAAGLALQLTGAVLKEAA